MTYTIQNITSPTRLLDYCKSELKTILPSKNSIVKAIKRQELLLNNEPTATGIYVKNGDLIKLDKTNTAARHKLFELKIDVLYEDEHLAVINKPAGYDVSGNKFKTIQNALLFNIKKNEGEDALAIPRPVHRIDNRTSGLLLVAKTQASAIHLSKQFEVRNIRKTYNCISVGNTPETFSNTAAIEEQQAETHFKNL